jgi:heparan-alpha-glucosaminide N-acetyltransferase
MADTYRLRQQQREAEGSALVPKTAAPPAGEPAARLVSLDAYRGFIMLMLAASGFGIARFAALPEGAPVWQEQNRQTWQAIAFHFDHPGWESKFGLMGVSFWDLIQPAFMFMVGVAMPFSYLRREKDGHSGPRRFAHAAWRALLLVLLGVFLYSMNEDRTNWVFTNVLAQIGLGYLFAYLLLGRSRWVQWTALFAILVGYWYFFWQYTPQSQPAESAAAAAPAEPAESGVAESAKTDATAAESFPQWTKGDNAAHAFDLRFLNLLRNPADEELAAVGASMDAGDWAPGLLRDWLFANDEVFSGNTGGYQTLNFVPSIATMLLGILCGQFLIRRRLSWKSEHWQTVGILVAWGMVAIVAALLADAYACPIVKRIWTPSWVLFSGAYVIWMLAAFYVLFDILPLGKLAFPLVVIGGNSIAAYLMGQLLRSWTAEHVVHTHLSGLLATLFGQARLVDDMYGRLITPTATFVVFWLILYWMYRQRYFVRL